MSSRKNAPAGWIPSHFVSICLLIVLTAVTYANSLHGRFVFDDLQLVQQDPALMNVKTFGDAVSLGVRGGWRQLLSFTYALNYYAGGLDTFGYHLVNLGLHIINVLLIYGIILAFLREDDRWRYVALGGAAVFGVHTLLSGAVSYIAGRSSVLCATFYFAAIYLFFKGLNSERRMWRPIFFALAAVAGWLAWNAKQEAITLPVFLAIVLFLRTEKTNWRWIAPLTLTPLILIFLLRNQIRVLYTEVMANQVLVAAGFGSVLPPAAYFRTYITSVVGYFFPRFVVPASLSVDPLIAPVDHWYSPEFLVSLAALAALACLAWRFFRRQPLLSLAITATLISPLMAYAAIPLPDVVLEHRAYIPGLGIALMFAWVFQCAGRRNFSARWAAVAIPVVIFASMTVSRNLVFANNISLWEDAVAKSPEKPRPHFNLGQAYQDAQRLPEAIQEYERALSLKPDIHAAYSNLAALYLDQRQFDKGEEMLLKVTSMSPNFTEGFINLAVLYIRRQEPDKALTAINRALQLNSESFAAHFNKGEILTQKGDYKAALESYKTAVHLRPDLDGFKLTLGNAYIRAGDTVSAEKQFNELTTGPLAAEAFRSLGLLYNNAGQADQAMQYFQQAAQLKPEFPDLHHDMGLVYFRKQLFDAAIEQFRTVLQQQPDHGPAVLNLAASYQMKGDLPDARQALEGFIQQYGKSNSPYVAQAQQRLLALR